MPAGAGGRVSAAGRHEGGCGVAADEQPRAGTPGRLPGARDAREAVPGLRVPHAHVARQAAAHQQHAVAGQTLDVLQGHSAHTVRLRLEVAPRPGPAPSPQPRPLTMRCPRSTSGTISVSGGA